MKNKIKIPRWYSSISFKDSIILGLLLLVDINIHGRDFCRGYRKPIHDHPFQLFNEYLEKLKKKKSSQLSSLYRLKKEKIFDVTKDKVGIDLDSDWWQDLFNLKFRFFTASKKWDGNWTVVTYDIPEKQKSARRDIRNLLVKLGFVQMHRSVWITINNVENYLRKTFEQFQPNLFCFRAESLFNKKDKEIITTLFKPHVLEDKYKTYLGLVKTAIKTKKLSSKIKLLKEFPDLIIADKGIPAEFFENEFIRSELWKKTKKLQTSIL